MPIQHVSLPEQFHGAWRRVWIELDGRPAGSGDWVLWLQGTHAFADIRIPSVAERRPVCFAGTTTWMHPKLRWQHHLDLVDPGVEDVGEIEHDGDDLIERGTFVFDGRTASYVECWRRLGNASDIEESVGPTAIDVRVGRWSLSVGDDRPAGGRFRAELSWLGRDSSRAVYTLDGEQGTVHDPTVLGTAAAMGARR